MSKNVNPLKYAFEPHNIALFREYSLSLQSKKINP